MADEIDKIDKELDALGEADRQHLSMRRPDAPRKQRPGYLNDYARHAGISKQAASVQLRRVGINCREPFDFDEADRLRAAYRHASRLPFAAPIVLDDDPKDGDIPEGDQQKNPALAAVQIRKEEFRARLLELQFRKESRELVEKNGVEAEAFRVARQVRDAVLNVPSRIAGPIAAEMDQRRVHDLLEKELRQALEALVLDDTPTVTLTREQLRWYNAGVVLLMAIMNGRKDCGEAERQVFEDWRKQGNLIDQAEGT